jgi:hypothetical protein
MNLKRCILPYLAVVLVALTGCTHGSGTRIPFNVLQQQECQRQSPAEERGQCVHAYDREYDQYQRERKRITSTPQQED